MGESLKVGVIGTGKMGAHHVQKYLTLPGVELVGVFDADSSKREWAEKTLGTRWFDSVSDLLFEADAVSVASATASHYSICRQALDAGVHVLVEKPITDQVSQAEELIRVARRRNLVLQVGFIERFRYLSLAGSLPQSPVRFIECHRMSPTLSREKDIDVITDLMIHDLDLVLYLMGSEPTLISSIGVPVITPHYDIANTRLEFPNGGVANLTASRISPKAFRKFRSFSAEGYASMDFVSNSLEYWSRDGRGGVNRKVIESSPFDALSEQIGHFVSCVIEGRQPLVTGEDGLRALRLAEQIKKKIETRSGVDLHAPLPGADQNTIFS